PRITITSGPSFAAARSTILSNIARPTASSDASTSYLISLTGNFARYSLSAVPWESQMFPAAQRRAIVCLLVADKLVIPISKRNQDFSRRFATIQVRFCLRVRDLRCYTVFALFEVVKPFQSIHSLRSEASV